MASLEVTRDQLQWLTANGDTLRVKITDAFGNALNGRSGQRDGGQRRGCPDGDHRAGRHGGNQVSPAR